MEYPDDVPSSRIRAGDPEFEPLKPFKSPFE
jgi:hypothetical protein